MDKKPVLAIETSQAQCSACIYFDSDKYFQAEINLKNAHAEKIFELIDTVLKTSGIVITDLDYIAYSSGPGSFTGLRIGLSAAKGIAYGAGLPLVPVPTFEALAYKISIFLPEAVEFVIANKVNMEEVYYARFKIKDNSFIFTRNLEIITRESLILNETDVLYYGNVTKNHSISAPEALYLAEWSRKNDLKKYLEFDELEPGYLKTFIAKEKKK
jgi:tRNA threonylcarbamoyladenosine biosynthesis protein TsaB